MFYHYDFALYQCFQGSLNAGRLKSRDSLDGPVSRPTFAIAPFKAFQRYPYQQLGLTPTDEISLVNILKPHLKELPFTCHC